MTSYLLLWRTKSSKKGIYSKKKEFVPLGTNSFLEELTPIENGSINENSRVAFPESRHIHYKGNTLL